MKNTVYVVSIENMEDGIVKRFTSTSHKETKSMLDGLLNREYTVKKTLRKDSFLIEIEGVVTYKLTIKEK